MKPLDAIQGAIMAVGASKPTVVVDAEGFFSVKNKMLVCSLSNYYYKPTISLLVPRSTVFMSNLLY